jgi:hypothetical protein
MTCIGPTPPSLAGVAIHSHRLLTYVVASIRGSGTWRAAEAASMAGPKDGAFALTLV